MGGCMPPLIQADLTTVTAERPACQQWKPTQEAQRGTTSGVSGQPPGSRLITLGHLITEGAAFCSYRNRHNGFRFAIMLLPKQPLWTCIMPFHHVLHSTSLLIKELNSQQIKKVWQQVHAQGVIHPLRLSRHPPSPTLRTTLSHLRISWFWGFWTRTYSIGFPVQALGLD